MQPLRGIDWLFVLAVPAALACGGDKSQRAAPAPAAALPAQPTPAPAPAAPQAVSQPATPDAAGIVRISTSDQMRFSATRIEVSSKDARSRASRSITCRCRS